MLLPGISFVPGIGTRRSILLPFIDMSNEVDNRDRMPQYQHQDVPTIIIFSNIMTRVFGGSATNHELFEAQA